MTGGPTALTADQVKDLLAGKYYVNVHTAKNPGGEIRGQITKAPQDPLAELGKLERREALSGLSPPVPAGWRL